MGSLAGLTFLQLLPQLQDLLLQIVHFLDQRCNLCLAVRLGLDGSDGLHRVQIDSGFSMLLPFKFTFMHLSVRQPVSTVSVRHCRRMHAYMQGCSRSRC